MTRVRPYADTEGHFGPWRESEVLCIWHSPEQHRVECRGWSSNDGAYEDVQYRCDCGARWWVDGDDG